MRARPHDAPMSESRRDPRSSTPLPRKRPRRPPPARALAEKADKLPRPSKKRPRLRLDPRVRALLWGAAGLGATLALAALALFVGFGRAPGPKGAAPGDVIEIDWPPGLDTDAAATRLAELGLVQSRDAMAVLLRASGGVGSFVPGPHLIPRGASPWELRQLLSRSSSRPRVRVVVPEGFNRFDLAARLEKLRVAGKRAFLAASADPLLLDDLAIERAGSVGAESAEGYLFPATYELAVDTDPRDVVRRLVAEADRRWAAIATQHADGLASLRAALGWGRREVLTLASMVEKEAGADDERPLVASVFLNRLLDPSFRPKRLQSDPTAAYGCLAAPDEAPSCAGFTGKPTPAINADAKNRYSTYAHAGLPPGPIANPGVRSIQAVLAPASTRYFYFVATGGGRHTFSETIDAHNQAVRKLRAAAHP